MPNARNMCRAIKWLIYTSCSRSHTIKSHQSNTRLGKETTKRNRTILVFTCICCIRRSLYYSRIPHSNLLLVYITDDEPNNRKLDASLQKITYDTPFPCHKRNVNNLSTRPLTDCFTQHPDVSNAIKSSRINDLLRRHFSIFFILFSGRKIYCMFDRK